MSEQDEKMMDEFELRFAGQLNFDYTGIYYLSAETKWAYDAWRASRAQSEEECTALRMGWDEKIRENTDLTRKLAEQQANNQAQREQIAAFVDEFQHHALADAIRQNGIGDVQGHEELNKLIVASTWVFRGIVNTTGPITSLSFAPNGISVCPNCEQEALAVVPKPQGAGK